MTAAFTLIQKTGLRALVAAAILSIPLDVVHAQAAAAPANASVPIEAYKARFEDLAQKGDFAGLERLARQALGGFEAQGRPKDRETAVAAGWLGVALERQGRLGEAESPYRRALDLSARVYGEQDPYTALTLNNLASLLMQLGRAQEAEALLRRGLAIREASLGPSHPDVATSLTSLGLLLLAQGRYAEAEPLLRRAVSISETAPGQDTQETANSINVLAQLLFAQGRYSEADPMMRRVLAIERTLLGPDHPDTATALGNLAGVLQREGRYADAEPMMRQSLAVDEKALGPSHPLTGTALNNLAELLLDEGRLAEAEPLLRRALDITQRAMGPDHADTASALNNLASALLARGSVKEAEALYRQALEVNEKALGPAHPVTAASLNNLAQLLSSQGRYAEAEPLLQRSQAIYEQTLGPEHPATAVGLNNLAILMQNQRRFQDADARFRRALEIRRKALGPRSRDVGDSLNGLGMNLFAQGRAAEAEPLFREALKLREVAIGPEHQDTANALINLGAALGAQGRYAEAEPLVERGVAIFDRALGPDHSDTVTARERLADLEALQSRYEQAIPLYRLACRARTIAVGEALVGEALQASRLMAGDCSTRLALSLWGWANEASAPAAAGRGTLRSEAFDAAQRGQLSAAGDALGRRAAQAAAEATGQGDDARAYETALLERMALDQAFAQAASETGERRAALAKARLEVMSRLERLASALRLKAPRYWDYRSPDPVGVAALQARSGPDAALLHLDEALILFLTPPGKARGLVFALSKDRVAWAQTGFTGDDLRTRVTWLRTQIAEGGRGFDRKAAYELYRGLLGDAAIQRVIAPKGVLLIVPSGPLTSLPPGLLVTAPPKGGRALDVNPRALRSTAWLLRSKAVALLPTVATLRTLRQLPPKDRAALEDPLLAFADPDFGGPPTSIGVRGVGNLNSYYRDGQPLREALYTLPRLPGTRVEGEALVKALGAGPGSLLLGSAASKSQLMARNADGRLAKVRVLEFATHGLVAGDVSGLAEPALVLAAGVTPEDQLLRASEAATLHLNADWVLLSACNTASPDAPEAQGLSGLTRAFFFAGARSLLVSHWAVRDDVAARLIPEMLRVQRTHTGLTRAAALRAASLAILDDVTLDAAGPAAWAPFTLIGEAGR